MHQQPSRLRVTANRLSLSLLCESLIFFLSIEPTLFSSHCACCYDAIYGNQDWFSCRFSDSLNLTSFPLSTYLALYLYLCVSIFVCVQSSRLSDLVFETSSVVFDSACACRSLSHSPRINWRVGPKSPFNSCSRGTA